MRCIAGAQNALSSRKHVETAQMTRIKCWTNSILLASFISGAARADNFGGIHYDKKTDRLVVTMLYRGTNPNHRFSLRWGTCQNDQGADPPGVTAEVLDDQFEDLAQRDFQKTVRFSLTDLPCPRPVKVTLRTAPRFFHTLTVP
jgi:hypothetical protein